MMRRRSASLGPLGFVFASLGSFFADLVGYCTAGVWGVLAAMALVFLIAWAVASDIAASADRQARADEQWPHHYHEATYTATMPRPRPRPRPRTGARGGVR